MLFRFALLTFIAFTLNSELCQASNSDFKRSRSNVDIPIEAMDIDQGNNVRTKLKQSKTVDSEEIFEMSSSDSAGRLAELLSKVDVAKAPAKSFDDYVESVYQQKEKIDLETIKAYGVDTVLVKLFLNMYEDQKVVHFILQIYLNDLHKELGFLPPEEFMSEHRNLFIAMNKAALKGDGDCSFNLAYAYFFAICLEEDLRAAISFFELSVKHGNEKSRNCLMNIYQRGICKLVDIDNRTYKRWVQPVDIVQYEYWKNYQNQARN